MEEFAIMSERITHINNSFPPNEEEEKNLLKELLINLNITI